MSYSKNKYVSIAILLLVSLEMLSQNLPIIPVPQPANPYQRPIPSNYSHPLKDVYRPDELSDIQRRNQAIMREVDEHQKEIYAEIRRQSMIKTLVNSGFPSQSAQAGTSCYYKAFHEIDSMLKSQAPLNLGRVVFLVENAYYGDSLSYIDYRQFVKRKVALAEAKIRQRGLDETNNMVKNLMLFSLLTDTLKIKSGGKDINNYPLKYNLDDYQSRKNYDSHFVTKLMQTGIGQCHSMPLYYLVLAEEMGAEAYWAFSPQHSFVKVQEENGVWHNLELTCGAVLSDVHYMNNSYIKAEALRSRIYLEPLNKSNTVAELLIELAEGYYSKYGLDDFYLKCMETAEQYLDNKLDALKGKAAYQTRLVLFLAQLLNTPNPEAMKEKLPAAYKHYESMISLYQQIDDLGYEELPEGIYERWLAHVAKEKDKANKDDERKFTAPILRRGN